LFGGAGFDHTCWFWTIVLTTEIGMREAAKNAKDAKFRLNIFIGSFIFAPNCRYAITRRSTTKHTNDTKVSESSER
jgi:hypothetical protein